MALLMPGARVIVCDRDPRDVGLSIFTFRFYGVHAYAHDLGDLGWYIGQQKRLMAHWARALPNPIMTVRLNDWVEDSRERCAGCCGFSACPMIRLARPFTQSSAACARSAASQVRDKVNARGIGRWRDYESQLSPLIGALAQSGALEDWG